MRLANFSIPLVFTPLVSLLRVRRSQYFSGNNRGPHHFIGRLKCYLQVLSPSLTSLVKHPPRHQYRMPVTQARPVFSTYRFKIMLNLERRSRRFLQSRWSCHVPH